MLDNARDTAQVTPLLPGGTSAAVPVTSRHRLTGLAVTHDAKTIAVQPLDERQLAELMSGHLGAARVAAEPDPTATLLRHRAGMPLALGILAARANAHPDVPLSALAEEVRDASARLDALDTGDLPTSLRAVYSASVRVLNAGTATLFGFLGLIPGPDITVVAAAALADLPVPRARRAIRELEEAHLVHQHVPGRYRMHDLVRLHAGELAGADGGTALERLFDHCCYTASITADQFTPGEPHRRPPIPDRSGPVVAFPSFRDAIAWLNAESTTLLAVAAQGSPRHTAHLSRALARYLDSIANFHDALALHTAAVTADSRDGYALANRGLALHRLGHTVEARGLYERALTHAEAVGDLALENIASTNLGVLCSDEDGDADGMRHHERALSAAKRGGYQHSEGIALVNLGVVYTGRARLGDARACLERSAQIARQLHDPGLGAVALSGLGLLHQRLGEPEAARDYHRRAAELAGSGVLRTINVGVLNDRASAVHRADGPETALDHYREATALPCTPLYLRYNSGRHVSDNGRELADLLDDLVDKWPVQVTDVVLVGHSMGGLVARSAIHQAHARAARWVSLVTRLVCLGTPHAGAPLERSVARIAALLDRIRPAAPLSWLLGLRSDGIKDLAEGYLHEHQWAGDEAVERAEAVLPEDVRQLSVSATVSRREDSVLGRVVGDLVVGPSSAADRGRNVDRRWLGGLTHFDLQRHDTVHLTVLDWLTTTGAGKIRDASARRA